MKIFGWMHHKIQLRRSYSILSHENGALDVKLKAKAITLEKDTHALLSNNHDALVDNICGWDDGILAIGTFGLHHLQLHQSDHVLYLNQLVEEDEEMKDEEKVVVDEYAIKDCVEHDHPIAYEKDEMKNCHQISNPSKKELMVEIEVPNLEGEKKKNGKRITLADLFYADQVKPNLVEGKAQILCEALPASMENLKEHNKKQRRGRSLAKKFMPWKGEDPNHTPKLQRLITKMLKKKIHPEFGTDVNGGGGSLVEANTKLPAQRNFNLRGNPEGNDRSDSLLQGAAITS